MGEVGIFDTLVVRPIRRDEVKLWSYCMRQHHYLGNRGKVVTLCCDSGFSVGSTAWVGIGGIKVYGAGSFHRVES